MTVKTSLIFELHIENFREENWKHLSPETSVAVFFNKYSDTGASKQKFEK